MKNFAEQKRIILSEWRTHLFFRRQSPHFPLSKVKRIINKLEKDGLVEQIYGARSLYQITSPFAPKEVNVFELLSEAYYTSVFCFGTALELHQLTDQRLQRVHLYLPEIETDTIQQTTPDESQPFFLPLGTSADEWRLIRLPNFAHISDVGGRKAVTHALKSEWLFGWEIKEYNGVPIRVTDETRTLIDGLRFPKWFGGLSEVLLAWARASENLAIDKVLDYTEKINQSILYQRVGFIVETLGFAHAKLDDWKATKAIRGGSRLLNPEAPYHSEFSEQWKISINHPVDVLKNKETFYS